MWSWLSPERKPEARYKNKINANSDYSKQQLHVKPITDKKKSEMFF